MGPVPSTIKKAIEVVDFGITSFINGVEPPNFQGGEEEKPTVEELRYQFYELVKKAKFSDLRSAY